MVHELKIHPQYYKDVLLGLKKVEIRLNDRDFKEGDTLVLNEYCPKEQKYTGCQVKRKVDNVYKGLPGVLSNYVVMQISK